MIIRHGFSDERILVHLARQWPLDDRECQATLDAAHILVRKEHPNGNGTESV